MALSVFHVGVELPAQIRIVMLWQIEYILPSKPLECHGDLVVVIHLRCQVFFNYDFFVYTGFVPLLILE